ncbi:hypothetical protein C4K18_3066 [Pseudomonas chlororaphis subsp. aurantiaca]|nr:hypothetical protein C4K18_3066 [Pseudomonas chlororaphis subsp. aurantiaca]
MQWYFQRYVSHLSEAGEIVLFRPQLVQPLRFERVMGFCNAGQHNE